MNIVTFNKLKKYENFLYTAEYADFIRTMTVKELDGLVKIAEADLDIHFKPNHCPKCTLNFVQKVAKLWYEQKEKNENNAKKKKEKK